MVRYQASQIRKYAATERYSNIEEFMWHVVSYNIIDPIEKDRTCGIMKITAKEKVNLSFDIAANASTIFYWYSMDCGRGEAYNGQISSED